MLLVIVVIVMMVVVVVMSGIGLLPMLSPFSVSISSLVCPAVIVILPMIIGLFMVKAVVPTALIIGIALVRALVPVLRIGLIVIVMIVLRHQRHSGGTTNRQKNCQCSYTNFHVFLLMTAHPDLKMSSSY